MAISKEEAAKLVATGGRGELLARMHILADTRGYVAGTPDPAPPPAAPIVPPVANPPAGVAASNPFDLRGEVERLAKSADPRDQVLARVGILNNPQGYVDSFKAPPATAAETDVTAPVTEVKP